MRTLKIGVVGYCPPTKFDEYDANEMLAEAFDAVLSDHPDATDIWVVSGLTDVGVLSLAYHAAVLRGWKTMGIACAKVEASNPETGEKQFPLFPVDEHKIVGQNWGDESETFLREIDVLIRIGGGKQSLAEVKTFSRNGGRTYEYELAAIPD